MSDWPWDLKFEVAFDTDPASEPGVWTDLSARINGSPVQISQSVGDTSTATLVLNNRDRALDPTNGAATYNLVPWRHARLTATYNAVTYPLFRGFVEDWPPVWPEFNQGLVAVRLVDSLAWLALSEADVDLPEQESHERVTALLDLVGWPAGLRDISNGVVRLEPYEQVAASPYRVLQDTIDAEDGLLYVAPDGKITFRSRHHDFDAASTLTLGPNGLPVSAVSPRYGGRDLVNIARTELADGDVYEIVDDASVTAFGPHSLSMRDLSLRAAEAEALPQWYVVRYSSPRLELDGVETKAHRTGALAQLLPGRLGDVVTFEHTPPGGGTVEMVGTLQSVEHSIGKGEWVTSMGLRHWHGEGPWFTWDNPTRGWDMGAKWAP